MPLKFIHCSDVHLDSAMGTNLPAAAAQQRRGELLETFLALIDYAKQEQVAAVLIAGDLFDGEGASPTTVDLVFRAMEAAPDVDFLCLPGNHDGEVAAFSLGAMPANLHVFGPRWQRFDYGEVSVWGCAIIRGNCETLYESLQLEESAVNVVMLHGQVGTKAGLDLIDLTQLRGRGIDYLALGHIHSFKQQKLDARGTACYCGCLEGRGFDECGAKGFVELTCDNGMVSSEFVPFACRRLHEVPLDITDVENVSTMVALAQAAAQDIPQDDLVKFVLQGDYSPNANKDLAYLEKTLGRDFFFVKVKDESRLRVEPSEYAYDRSLRGEFVRLVMASDEPEAEKQRIIACGLRALRGEEVTL